MVNYIGYLFKCKYVMFIFSITTNMLFKFLICHIKFYILFYLFIYIFIFIHLHIEVHVLYMAYSKDNTKTTLHSIITDE